MDLTINGKKQQIEDAGKLADVLKHIGVAIDRGGVAVAVNDRVVPRADWAGARLHAGDRVEIIRAVQGG